MSRRFLERIQAGRASGVTWFEDFWSGRVTPRLYRPLIAYFLALSATEYCVFSHAIFKVPPPAGFFSSVMVN